MVRETAIQIAKEKGLIYNEDITKINDKGNFSVVDVRVSQMDISDIRGLPKFDEETKTTRWYYPNFLPKNSQGLIFLDELNLASPMVQASCYSLVLDKRVGDYCFSKDTKVMTENGLKYFFELTKDDKIMTLNPITQKIEYHKSDEIIILDYEGKMYEFTGNCINFLVSPNHNVYMRRNDTTNKTFRFMKAETLAKRATNHYESKKYGDWKGIKREYFIVPLPKKLKMNLKNYEKAKKLYESGLGSVKISRKLKIRLSLIENWIYYKRNPANKCNSKNKFKIEDWMEFLGWFISEGCIVRIKKHSYRICLSQSKGKNKENCEQIKKLIERMGFRFRQNDSSIELNSYVLYQYLQKFGKSVDKYIPSYIKNLDRKYLEILLETLIKGDGCIKSKRCKVYYTISEKLKNDFIEIAIKCGYGITFSKKKNNLNSSIWSIYITKEKTPVFKNINIIDYNDKIYCVNVKNHIIMVERNGRMGWSGNCLPSNWAIISAGNRLEDKANVFETPAPLNNRFIHIELEVPSVDDWVDNFAIRNKIDTRISTFLKFKPVLYKFDKNVKDKAFCTPRTWAICSEMISDKETRDLDTINILVASCVGEATAIEFTAWLKLSEKIDIDEILKNPLEAKLPREIDMTYAMISGILEHYKKDRKLMKPIIQLATRLTPEFAVMMLKLVKTHNTRFVEEVVNLPEWKKDLAKKLQPYFKDEVD
jgi:hypothetical protein